MDVELTVGRPGLSALQDRAVDKSSMVQPRVDLLSELVSKLIKNHPGWASP